ncbi:MAG: hypothetical protein ABI114_00480 [Rhodanobacter sp.]
MLEEYQCVWKPTERDLKMAELARRYHTEAEAFDRTVCTGPIREGSILPATPREMAAISKNAHELRREIMANAERHGITRDEMNRAIGRAA